MLKEQDSTIHPTASSLIYAGKSLDDSKTLEECNIPNDSTLHYSSGNNTTNNNSPVEPSVKAIPTSSISAAVTKSSSSPARKNRKRCSSKNCLSAPLRNIGDCSFCEGHFCSKHRLLEQHQCVGLKNCKQQLHKYVFLTSFGWPVI